MYERRQFGLHGVCTCIEGCRFGCAYWLGHVRKQCDRATLHVSWKAVLPQSCPGKINRHAETGCEGLTFRQAGGLGTDSRQSFLSCA